MLLESLRKVYCRHKSHQFLVLVSLTANMKFVQKQVPNAYLRPLRNDRWEHQGIITLLLEDFCGISLQKNR